jgi:signal transduction histidine kinase
MNLKFNMKRFSIRLKLFLGFGICIILSAVIGTIAVISLTGVRQNNTAIKIAADIEKEVLECRRQEKNIMLFGPDKREIWEGVEEKSYLEKLNNSLIALKDAVNNGANFTPKYFGEMLYKTHEYEEALKSFESANSQRMKIMKDIEAHFDKMSLLLGKQDKFPQALDKLSAVKLLLQSYASTLNEQHINKINSEMARLKATLNQDFNHLADEYTMLFNQLVTNIKYRDTSILSMRRKGREIQGIALNIIADAERRTDAYYKMTKGFIWATIILGVFIGGGIVFFIYQSIAQPLHKLTNVAQSVTGGDLNQQADIKSKDEIGDLARSFNDMITKLQVKINQLKQAESAIATREREKSEFMYKVAHELRAPLAAIKSCLSVALEYYPGDITGKPREMAERAACRSEGLMKLVRDLLNLSRATEIYDKTTVEALELDRLLLAVIELYRPEAQKHNIRLVTQIETQVKINGEGEGLEEVFGNLLSNAIKYSPENTQITISLSTDNDWAYISFTDQGIGIAKDDLPLLFTDFFRTKNAKALHVEGTGLGLSLSKRIVMAHKGMISIESDPGRGSCFKIQLPRPH